MKVDMKEIHNFSDDLKKEAEEIQGQLDQVKTSLGTINGMECFSGKAAKQAKQYFSDAHLTLLSSFHQLFDNLSERVEQHIQSFEQEVDSEEDARIKSSYLEEISEDIKETYKELKEHNEEIGEIIEEVTDISSARPPDFSDVSEYYHKTRDKLKDVADDLNSFSGKKQDDSAENLIHHIETTMNRAQTQEGKARFSDYVDGVALEGLPFLKETAKDYERKRMYDQLNMQDPVETMKNVDVDVRYTGDEKKKDPKLGGGTLTYQKGNQEMIKGEDIDYEELGLKPDKTTVNGYEISYAMVDGELVIYKDNPDLTYYTNRNKMGHVNHTMAKTTKMSTRLYTDYVMGRVGMRGLNKANPTISNRIKQFNNKHGDNIAVKGLNYGAPMFASDFVQGKLPYWNKIITAPVPDVGDEEIVLYVSDDDGKSWNGKMRFETKKDGTISHKEF